MRLSNVEPGVLGSVLSGDRIFFGKLLKEILNLHPHDQVRSAFQIQAEMNVIREIGFDTRRGKVVSMRAAPVRSNDYIEPGQGNDGDRSSHRSIRGKLLC